MTILISDDGVSNTEIYTTEPKVFTDTVVLAKTFRIE